MTSARRKAARQQGRKAVLIVCAALLAVLAYATNQRNQVWQSESTLWADVVQKSPMKPRVRINLANVYRAEQKYDDAIREFRTAEQLAQTLPPQSLSQDDRTRIRQMTGVDLVVIYIQTGQFDKAAAEAEPLWKEFPGLPGIGASLAAIALHYSQPQLAIALIDQSLQEVQQKRWGAQSSGLNQGYLYWNKAEALKLLGNCNEAMPLYQKAAEVDPDLTAPSSCP